MQLKTSFKLAGPYQVVALIITLVWLNLSCAPVITQTGSVEPNHLASRYLAAQGEFAISYQVAGTNGQPLVVFVHGTPGSSQAFAHLLKHPKLQACCRLVAVDRLGFGESAGSGVQADFDVQASAITTVFSQNQSDAPVLVVGHSLGGSIAAKVAIDNPDQVGALLIISSALDPELNGPRWYQRLADLPIIKQIIPVELHRANEEMLELMHSLEAMSNGWDNLSIPITIFQGAKDPLVHYDNTAFAEQKLPASLLTMYRFPKDGHFILWERPEFVVEQILSLLQGMTAHPTNQH